jgi:thiosulfate dehydrogenase [quinone] large subunit
MKNQYTAYFFSRAAVGLSMATHGLVRIPKIDKFSNGMLEQFASSIIPAPLVNAFSHALPFLELATGIMLCFGVFTRIGLVLGNIIMLMLLFGTGMIENWEAIPSQLIHVAFFSVLLVYLDLNKFSIDDLNRKSQLK